MTSRRLVLTEARIREYSRRGNYHSEPATAAALGLPGLVAQGVHVAGPAYGTLLDAWGEEFLAHGEIELQFVGMVLAGEEVEATVTLGTGADAGQATVEVRNATTERVAVVGHAQRVARP